MNLEEFLTRNGVDYEGFVESYARKILRVYEEYDESISRFAIFEDRKKEKVNAKDLLGGPDYLFRDSGLLDNFVSLFNPYGDTYHSRANGMLEYSSDEVIERLDRSFREEPILLSNIGDKLFLSGNGNHRIHLLMMHYYMDTFKGKDVEDKYVFPAEVKHLDLIKTYANYMGSLLWDESFKVISEYDIETFVMTGRSLVKYHGEELVLTDEQLIEFLRERLEALKALDEDYYIDAVEAMWNRYQREESGMFKQFVELHLPELENVLMVENYMELENTIRSNLLEGVSYGNS